MQRVVTGLIVSTLFIAAVLLLPSLAFLALVAALIGLAVFELVRLLETWAPRAPLISLYLLAPLFALALIVAPTLPARLYPGVLLAAGVAASVALGSLVLLARTPAEEMVPALGALAFGAAYLAVPAYSLWRLQRTEPLLVLWLLAVVALNDTAAYYVGSTVGRHKMAPRVSPNKTWEGSVAGLAAGILATVLWSLWRQGEILPVYLALGAAATVASQLGDLVESMLKRGAGVKDSGALLPGHGGLLDRADGIFFAAPVLLLGVWWAGILEL